MDRLLLSAEERLDGRSIEDWFAHTAVHPHGGPWSHRPDGAATARGVHRLRPARDAAGRMMRLLGQDASLKGVSFA